MTLKLHRNTSNEFLWKVKKFHRPSDYRFWVIQNQIIFDYYDIITVLPYTFNCCLKYFICKLHRLRFSHNLGQIMAGSHKNCWFNNIMTFPYVIYHSLHKKYNVIAAPSHYNLLYIVSIRSHNLGQRTGDR